MHDSHIVQMFVFQNIQKYTNYNPTKVCPYYVSNSPFN